MRKFRKLNKEQLRKLAEALKKRNEKTEKKTENNKKAEEHKIMEKNKFIEAGIVLEKISPVLKPAVRVQERLEQRASSFLLQKKSKENQTIEKPYEFEKQKYFSQSDEYKTLYSSSVKPLLIQDVSRIPELSDKTQTENLQNSTGIEKGMVHMGVEQATKRKQESFFDEKLEQKYSANITPLEEVKKREKKMYTSR